MKLGLFFSKKSVFEASPALPEYFIYGETIHFPESPIHVEHVRSYFRSRIRFTHRLAASILTFALLLPLLTPFTTVANAANVDWLNGWRSRKRITISRTNVDAALSNFPLYVKINADSDMATARADGYDIRFTDSANNTLAHEIESWSGGGGSAVTAHLWVKVPSINDKSLSADTFIYVYYNNPSASTNWTTLTSKLSNCTSITNAQCVWKEGANQNFKAVYHLKENGHPYSDSTSNANNSTSTTTDPAQATGQVGNGQTYATGKFINMSNGSSLTITSAMTISAWIKTTNAATQSILSHYNNSSPFQGYGFEVLSTGYMRFWDGNGAWRNGTSATVNDGNFHYVGAVHNGSNSVSFYKDSVAQAIAAAAITSYTTNLLVGMEPDGVSKPFIGTMDELRISATARAAEWVKFEYYNMSTTNSYELTFGNPENNVSWLTGWNYRKRIMISRTNVDSVLSNFPLYVKIDNDSDLSLARADGYDVRFTDSNGNILPYERETWTGGAGTAVTANLWVKVPQINPSTAGNATYIYIYVNNPSATTDWTATTATGDCSAITYAKCVWKEGANQNFAGVWHLPNGSTLTVNDSTNNNNNGSLPGGSANPTAATGKVDGAAAYDSANSQYINAGTSSTLNLQTTLTTETWFKANSDYTSLQMLVATSPNNNGSTTNYIFSFGFTDNKVELWNDASGSNIVSTTSISDNNWHHLVATREGTAGNWTDKIYIDGNLDKTQTSIATNPTGATNNYVSLGRMGGYNGYYLKGTEDEVRVSNIARSAAWIKFEYYNMTGTNNYELTFGNLEYASGMSNTWLNGWAYRKKITISKTNVDGQLANFPLLVKLTSDSDLAISRADGYDIRFTDADGRSLLDYERESWSGGGGSAATGIFWVRVPKINPSSATASSYIYMYYGNASITTDWTATGSPTHAKNVWDSSFKAVYHLNETGTNPQVLDSTTNGNNSTAQTWTPATGKVGGAASFSGSPQYIGTPLNWNTAFGSVATFNVWFKVNSNGDYALLATNLSGNYFILYNTGAALWMNDGSAEAGLGFIPTPGTWYMATMTKNGAAVQLFVNGNSLGTMNLSANAFQSATLEIGKSYTGSWYMNGYIDQIEMSSVVRSAAWIKFEYNNINSTDNELGIGSQEGSSTPDVWLAGWQNRKKITISNTIVYSTLSNFPLYVKVNADADFSNSRSDGFDIRFADASGNALAYERESWTGGNGSAATGNFWVKVPTIKNKFDSAGSFIYIYWGNGSISTDWTAATSTLANCTSITNAQCVWKEGTNQNFKAVWHLPNGSTLSATDSTSNANNGTLPGGSANPTATTGKVDGAGSFASANTQYINAGTGSSLDISTVTVESWINTSSNTAGTIYGGQTSDTTKGFDLVIGFSDAGGISAGTMGLYSSGSGNFRVSSGTINNGAWRHVVAVNSGNNLSLYIDGVLDRSVAQTTPVATSGTTKYIGKYIYNGTDQWPFNGAIDETRVSNTARTAAWIKFEYNNMNSSNQELTFGTKEGSSIVSTAWLAGWNNRKKITIDRTNISGSSALTNFPLLVRVTSDSDFSSALATGYDIRFTDSGGNILPYERESWTGGGGSAGTGNFWVKVPSINYAANTANTANTEIFLYYGNPNVTSDWTAEAYSSTQTNAQAVWDSNFKAVWHLKDGADTSHVADSTNGGFTGTKTSAGNPAEQAAKVGNGEYFDGTTKGISITGQTNNNTFTMSGWIKPNAGAAAWQAIALQSVLLGIGYIPSTKKITYYYSAADHVNTTALNDTDWNYFTVVNNAGNVTFYLNGAADGTATSAPGFNVAYIGDDVGTNSYPLKGWLDELRVSNSVRSAAWINFEYQNMYTANTGISLNTQENTATAATTWLAGWQNRKKITISRTNVDATLTNFPFLVRLSADADLAPARTDGYDIRFTDSSGNVLPYERETWSGGGGAAATANFWVNVPTINASTATTDSYIFMYFGNPSASVDWTAQGSPTNAQQVWDSSYKAVWHLPNGSTLTTSDSTTNNISVSNINSVAAATGKIDGGASFSGSNALSAASFSLSSVNKVSISFWMNWPSYSNDDKFAFEYTSNYNSASGFTIDPNHNGGNFMLSVSNIGGGGYNSAYFTRPSAGVWHLYTVTFDRTAGTGNCSTVYVDGVAQTVTQTQSGDQASTNFGTGGLYFMSRGGTSLMGVGTLDEVRLFAPRTSNVAAWNKFEYYNQKTDATSEQTISSLLTTQNLSASPLTQTSLQTPIHDRAVAITGWLTGWSYRKKVIINNINVTASLTNFPLLVKMTSDADLTTALATGYDIRFTDADGTTLLTYERESWSGGNGSAGTGVFWVKVPLIKSFLNTAIYVYYGNSSASDVSSTNTWNEGGSNNYKGVWHFANSGSTVYGTDSSGYGNSGTPGGSITAYTGIADGSAYFSNTNMTIGNNSSLDVTTNLTFEGWLNISQPSIGQGVFNGYNSGAGFLFNIATPGAGNIGLWTGGAQFWTAIAIPSTNVWHHYVVTNNNSKSIYYIDGVAQSPVDQAGANSGGSVTRNIGAYGGSQLFNTGVDEIRLSNTVRTPAWLKFEYCNMLTAASGTCVGSNELDISAQQTPTSQVAKSRIKATSSSAGMPPTLHWRRVGQ